MGFLARGRVVSLVPSVTESLLFWGVTPVAVTRFCEQPRLSHVGGTKDPDVDRIAEMRPDLVVMCHEENRREDHDALRAHGVRVLSLRVEGVEDAAAGLAGLARVLGLPDGLAGTRVPEPVSARSPRLRAFVPIWRRPWMALGRPSYGASLLDRIGVDVVGGRGRYPEVSLDAVAAASPDVVLAPTEPYPFGERHVAELSVVAPVALVDGQDLFWWGARTDAAQERLLEEVESLPRPGPG